MTSLPHNSALVPFAHVAYREAVTPIRRPLSEVNALAQPAAVKPAKRPVFSSGIHALSQRAQPLPVYVPAEFDGYTLPASPHHFTALDDDVNDDEMDEMYELEVEDMLVDDAEHDPHAPRGLTDEEREQAEDMAKCADRDVPYFQAGLRRAISMGRTANAMMDRDAAATKYRLRKLQREHDRIVEDNADAPHRIALAKAKHARADGELRNVLNHAEYQYFLDNYDPSRVKAKPTLRSPLRAAKPSGQWLKGLIHGPMDRVARVKKQRVGGMYDEVPGASEIGSGWM